MAKFSFSDIELAFMFVSCEMYGMNSAILCLDTGKILYRSWMADIDEFEDEEDLDWMRCIEVPHKSDLGLGRSLVFEFVDERLPGNYDRVRQMFRRRQRPALFHRHPTFLCRPNFPAWPQVGRMTKLFVGDCHGLRPTKEQTTS